MRYSYKNPCNEIELWNTNLKSLLEKKEVEEAGQGLNPQPSAQQAMMLTTRPERMDENCNKKSLSDQARTHALCLCCVSIYFIPLRTEQMSKAKFA